MGVSRYYFKLVLEEESEEEENYSYLRTDSSYESEDVHRAPSLPAHTQGNKYKPLMLEHGRHDEPDSCPDGAIFVGSPSPEPDIGHGLQNTTSDKLEMSFQTPSLLETLFIKGC